MNQFIHDNFSYREYRVPVCSLFSALPLLLIISLGCTQRIQIDSNASRSLDPLAQRSAPELFWYTGTPKTSTPRSNQYWEDLKKTGVDLLKPYNNCEDDRNCIVSYLDQAKSYGFRVITEIPRTLTFKQSGDAPLAEPNLPGIRDFVLSIQNHPAVVGINSFDEPELGYFNVWSGETRYPAKSPHAVTSVGQLLKEVAPSLPSFVVHNFNGTLPTWPNVSLSGSTPVIKRCSLSPVAGAWIYDLDTCLQSPLGVLEAYRASAVYQGIDFYPYRYVPPPGRDPLICKLPEDEGTIETAKDLLPVDLLRAYSRAQHANRGHSFAVVQASLQVDSTKPICPLSKASDGITPSDLAYFILVPFLLDMEKVGLYTYDMVPKAIRSGAFTAVIGDVKSVYDVIQFGTDVSCKEGCGTEILGRTWLSREGNWNAVLANVSHESRMITLPIPSTIGVVSERRLGEEISLQEASRSAEHSSIQITIHPQKTRILVGAALSR